MIKKATTAPPTKRRMKITTIAQTHPGGPEAGGGVVVTLPVPFLLDGGSVRIPPGTVVDVPLAGDTEGAFCDGEIAGAKDVVCEVGFVNCEG